MVAALVFFLVASLFLEPEACDSGPRAGGGSGEGGLVHAGAGGSGIAVASGINDTNVLRPGIEDMEEPGTPPASGPEVGGGTVWVPDVDAVAGQEKPIEEDLGSTGLAVVVGAATDSVLEFGEEDLEQVFAWSFKQVL